MRIRQREAARTDFEIKAYEIVQDFKRRCNAQEQTPFDRPLGAFKRKAYRLLRRTIADEGMHKVIKAVLRAEKKEPARLHYADNQFHFGLLAIDPHGVVTNKRRLWLWSRQMAYADKHNVPAHFLLGFLWQSGSADDISRKLEKGYREPWFGR